MNLYLEDQVALVMGSSRGIGYQIAESLAVEGAEVGIFSRKESDLREAAERIKAKSGKDALVLPGDSTQAEEVETAVNNMYHQHGRIDILVNCVGGYTPMTFSEMNDEHFTSLMETKWLGYIKAIRQVVPLMEKQQGGHILNMAGNSGRNPGYPHAGSVNAAVMNITKVLADELGPKRILVNAIAPGITRTDHAEHIMKTQAQKDDLSFEEQANRIASKIPLGNLGEPSDIADLAVFLVSPRNKWITGTNISVDGGTNRSVF